MLIPSESELAFISTRMHWCWHTSNATMCNVYISHATNLFTEYIGNMIKSVRISHGIQYFPCIHAGTVDIAETIGFTEVSDPNGQVNYFTLTCISTGGPATSITWTRDSEEVAEGSVTELNNREFAQYTHTLTVTGRLGGVYTCTVSNSKPSSAARNLTVQGKNFNTVVRTHL